MPSRKNYDPAEFTPLEDQIPVEAQSDPFPVDPAPVDVPAIQNAAQVGADAAYGRKTLVGAEIVYKGATQTLVRLVDKYGVVNTADLTGDTITMVDAQTLAAPPAILNPTIEVYPLLWQSGINDPQTATPEQLKTFYRLVLIAAAKAVKG